MCRHLVIATLQIYYDKEDSWQDLAAHLARAAQSPNYLIILALVGLEKVGERRNCR